MMSDRKYDYVIVGSGAGGATLAKELSGKGKSVAVFEKGIKEDKLGTFWDSCRFYDLNLMKMPPKSKEGGGVLAFLYGWWSYSCVLRERCPLLGG